MQIEKKTQVHIIGKCRISDLIIGVDDLSYLLYVLYLLPIREEDTHLFKVVLIATFSFYHVVVGRQCTLSFYIFLIHYCCWNLEVELCPRFKRKCSLCNCVFHSYFLTFFPLVWIAFHLQTIKYKYKVCTGYTGYKQLPILTVISTALTWKTKQK